MKSIFLSIVVICALAIAALGGTFATWSDSETSMSNVITTGSVDLKVNGEDDANPWGGQGVPTKVTIPCMVPDKVYGPFPVDLWNAGICDFPSQAYIHFKDMCCGNAPPKVDAAGYSTGYPDPQTGQLKPEPELVAEYGGKVDCRTVSGIGVTGDNCSMKSHIYCWVCSSDAVRPIYGSCNPNVLQHGFMINLECNEYYLMDLVPCQEETIYLYFYLVQESEEDYNLDYFADPGDPGFDPLEWQKFNDWPSWALMRDVLSFSIEFDLLLVPPLD